MKALRLTLIFLFVITFQAYSENININEIDPMPGFEKVTGPAFGEPVESYSGQGLVQYVSGSKIIINSKVFFIDESCKIETPGDQLQNSCIVKYELNKRARIISIKTVVQLILTGNIDRITSNEIVVDDQYFKFSLFATYHNTKGKHISRLAIEKGNFVGLALNKESKVESLWFLNGHIIY